MDTFLFKIQDMEGLDVNSSTLALEEGKVVFLPQHSFLLNDDEEGLLNDKLLAPKKKNISYHHQKKELDHFNSAYAEYNQLTFDMMSRFAEFSKNLVDSLFPAYIHAIEWGRTSYRPARVEGRSSSVLKDDTRLHVDAFKSTPVHGKRILRVFSNINPYDTPRVWHLGQPFSDVVANFRHQIPKYSNFKASLQAKLRLTKSKRSYYDHMMLALHDLMKRDDKYQQQVEKREFHFPAGSTWVVFTDQVSHAALGGQFLLEQSFYLPVDSQIYPEHSPMAQLNNVSKGNISNL